MKSKEEYKIPIFCPECGARRIDWANRAARFCRVCSYKNRRTSSSHGHTKDRASSRTYNSWRGMIDRCKPSKQYGKLGISVCERWRSFENFLADMGERPVGCEIDRKDPRGNYELGNCQWTGKRRNRQLRRTTRLTPKLFQKIEDMRGEGYSHQQIANVIGVAKSTVGGYLRGDAWRPINQEIPLPPKGAV